MTSTLSQEIDSSQIVKKHKLADGQKIVLCLLPGHHLPHATFLIGFDGAPVWGHYFEKLEHANRDYADRIKRGY